MRCRVAGAYHRVAQNKDATLDFGQPYHVLDRAVVFVAVQSDVPHASGGEQFEQAVRHADSRAQYRHDRKLLPGDDRGFHLRLRRFDRARGERQVARYLVTHQQSDFPQQLAEGPRGSVLVPHVRELVLDQRVIEDEQVGKPGILLHCSRSLV